MLAPAIRPQSGAISKTATVAKSVVPPIVLKAPGAVVATKPLVAKPSPTPLPATPLQPAQKTLTVAKSAVPISVLKAPGAVVQTALSPAPVNTESALTPYKKTGGAGTQKLLRPVSLPPSAKTIGLRLAPTTPAPVATTTPPAQTATVPVSTVPTAVLQAPGAVVNQGAAAYNPTTPPPPDTSSGTDDMGANTDTSPDDGSGTDTTTDSALAPLTDDDSPTSDGSDSVDTQQALAPTTLPPMPGPRPTVVTSAVLSKSSAAPSNSMLWLLLGTAVAAGFGYGYLKD